MPISTKTLLELRTLARRLSDMENSDFVSDAEFNVYINLGLQELYDLFAEVHGQEFFLKTQAIQLVANQAVYSLADDFHVLKGVDWLDSEPPPVELGDFLASTTWWVPPGVFPPHTRPLKPYMFFERHDGGSTEQGRAGVGQAQDMRFRIFTEQSNTIVSGDPLEVITPLAYHHRIRFNPLGGGWVLIWYIPTPEALLENSDVMVGFHGYEEYVSMFAAIRALRKEESDWGSLAADLESMKTRIRNMGSYRDMGHPSRVQDMSGNGSF